MMLSDNENNDILDLGDEINYINDYICLLGPTTLDY